MIESSHHRGGGLAAGTRERERAAERKEAVRAGPHGSKRGGGLRPTTWRRSRPEGGRMSTALDNTVMAHARRLITLVDGKIASDEATEAAA